MSWLPMTWRQSDYEFLAEIEARKNMTVEQQTKFVDESKDYEYASVYTGMFLGKAPENNGFYGIAKAVEPRIKVKVVPTLPEPTPMQRTIFASDIPRIKPGRIPLTAKQRQDIIKRKGGVCSKCGKREDLQIHHKDGDPSNNTKANLQLLCYTCHKKKHARLHHEVRYS